VTLDFTITFSQDENKQVKGTTDCPAQGAEGIKSGSIEINGSRISFRNIDPGAAGEPTFQGKLDETSRRVTGSLTQSGYEGTFSTNKPISEYLIHNL